ncbi:hypothetical protein HF521_008667 [Silurus meridionalis]|uniref:C2H2-type domain-containing protein n=1 Tax=Silurus meridionalis TaxID=175797 RepID=A0A8T0AR48_SILME|nr:hypothetical protein HF521_008667 [Silurus meridionalis]
MDNLDSLNTFLTERLMTVAGEIFQVFKDAFNDYQGEIERIKEENRCLREALAEIYNRVQERADKHDTSFIQVKLEVEASPGESDPQESRSHPLLSTPTPANLDKESNFPEKSKTKDENDDNSSSSSSSLNTVSSATVKVEPCRSQDVFSEKVKPEAQAENEPACDEQEPLSCTYCDQTFTEIPQLASHVQSHMALFTCEVCGKSFKQKGTLKTHMIVHRKDRPFACAEIFQVVKDTVAQYQDEIDRSKQENIYLRKMLAEVSISNGPVSTGAQTSRRTGFLPEQQNSNQELVDSETSLIQVKLELSTMEQDLCPEQEDVEARDAPTQHVPSPPAEDVTVKLEHGDAQVGSGDELPSCPTNSESQFEPNPQSSQRDFSNLPFHLQSPAAEKLFRSKVRRKPLRSDGNSKGRKHARSKEKKLRCDLCGKWTDQMSNRD